ncbi:MAG: hypothetical protein ABIG88_00120 [Patescibacteria group bacterium]
MGYFNGGGNKGEESLIHTKKDEKLIIPEPSAAELTKEQEFFTDKELVFKEKQFIEDKRVEVEEEKLIEERLKRERKEEEEERLRE